MRSIRLALTVLTWCATAALDEAPVIPPFEFTGVDTSTQGIEQDGTLLCGNDKNTAWCLNHVKEQAKLVKGAWESSAQTTEMRQMITKSVADATTGEATDWGDVLNKYRKRLSMATCGETYCSSASGAQSAPVEEPRRIRSYCTAHVSKNRRRISSWCTAY